MKIGLLDHMGYGNLGDAATQDVVIANIRKRLPKAELVGFSLIPHDTIKRHGIVCYPIWWHYQNPEESGNHTASRTSLKSRLKLALKSNPLMYPWAKPLTDLVREARFWVRSYRLLRSLDLLIISGGGQLDQLWHGPWLQPYTLFKFSVLTKLAGKQLYFLNVGAGPLENPLSQFFARWAVRLADYRSFRDHDSEQRMRSLGVKAKTQVFSDSVYALELRDHLSGVIRSNSASVVGLNPTGFCDPRIWPRKDAVAYQDYLEKLTRFSVWLLERGYHPRVFSTDIGVDRQAIEDLKSRLCPMVPPEVLSKIFPSVRESVTDALRQISDFDYIVTSKFHGIIFSHLLSKPVISLSYHRKMEFAMRALGQDRFCADIERFDIDWLIEAFNLLVDQSSSIRLGFADGVRAYATALSQQFDSLFSPDKWLRAKSRSSLSRKSFLSKVTP
jgi:polysaccharide pyruvyl transferase WcaK-like protein